MAKKNFDYFENMLKQVELGKKAASQLKDMLENYQDVGAAAEAIHETEHEADNVLHTILEELNRSFITPIEREDIVNLSGMLDDIVDSIEDVSNLFDMLSISEVKPEANEMAGLIYDCCDAMHDAITELPKFRSSKKLRDLIIRVNKVEEKGDKLHRSFLKKHFLTETNPIELIKWKEIFDMMESVLDSCEDSADLIDGIVIKNS